MTKTNTPVNRTRTQPDTASTPSQERPWPVRALSWLLLVQALGLFGLGLARFLEFNLDWDLSVEGLAFQLLSNLITDSVFVPLSLLALWAAIGFIRLWRSAWVNAMVLQGLSLAAALIIYFGSKPTFVYGVMFYSIFMVIYLHNPEVRLAFQADSRSGEAESLP